MRHGFRENLILNIYYPAKNYQFQWNTCWYYVSRPLSFGEGVGGEASISTIFIELVGQ